MDAQCDRQQGVANPVHPVKLGWCEVEVVGGELFHAHDHRRLQLIVPAIADAGNWAHARSVPVVQLWVSQIRPERLSPNPQPTGALAYKAPEWYLVWQP